MSGLSRAESGLPWEEVIDMWSPQLLVTKCVTLCVLQRAAMPPSTPDIGDTCDTSDNCDTPITAFHRKILAIQQVSDDRARKVCNSHTELLKIHAI